MEFNRVVIELVMRITWLVHDITCIGPLCCFATSNSNHTVHSMLQLSGLHQQRAS